MKTILLFVLIAVPIRAAWWDDVAAENRAEQIIEILQPKYTIRIKGGTTLRNHRFRMPCLVIMEEGSKLEDCTFNRTSSVIVNSHCEVTGCAFAVGDSGGILIPSKVKDVKVSNCWFAGGLIEMPYYFCGE